MADLQKIVDELSGLTVLEAAELAKGCPIFQNDGSVEVRAIQDMSAARPNQ